MSRSAPCSRVQCDHARLFGSVALGAAGPDNDADILVDRVSRNSCGGSVRTLSTSVVSTHAPVLAM
ncbi:nucleotidyltransferase domain-containing protein [Mycolicibacterium canariasense]|uniref:nucleotidyltransferase domain-containing protein n=1 Tax=Mycolicibacterium canariasense TaxID=228230 RepID=UPI003908BA47